MENEKEECGWHLHGAGGQEMSPRSWFPWRSLLFICPIFIMFIVITINAVRNRKDKFLLAFFVDTLC